MEAFVPGGRERGPTGAAAAPRDITDSSVAADGDAPLQLHLADRAVAEGDPDTAIRHLSSAIRVFTAAGDCRRAALTCIRISDVHSSLTGNLTAARAWQLRAERLVADEAPCVEQGWIAVAPVGCDVDDPAELLARAERALGLARLFGDLNLETKALADAGLAHVQAGRLARGMACLDEAMALACGLADDVDVAGKSVCSFFTACYYAADFDRVHSWLDTLSRQGLVGAAPGVPLMLSNHCDSVQATALCELGRWSEAEALLERSMKEYESGMRSPSWHAAIVLADLRVRQGRLADAESLLLGKDSAIQALLPTARLHLARGDLALARATARRGLRAMREDRLRAAELLAVLVDVGIRDGDLDAAEDACGELIRRAAGLDVPTLRVRVAVAEAKVQASRGQLVAAITAIETALDSLPSTAGPRLRATLLIELVRHHDAASNRAAARVEAARAVAVLDDLDIVVDPGDAALLARSGASLGHVADRRPRRTATLTREGRGWTLACDDVRAGLADSKGVRYLAELVRNPGVEQHVLDLVDRIEGTDPLAPRRRELGDAGEVIDAEARSAYRRRIEELRAEIDLALEVGADARAEAHQVELDQLVAQLATAFGLGGRSRRAASAAERARVNVTRAVRSAIARVSCLLPDAGAVLGERVRTGLYCSYQPEDEDPVHWSFTQD